MTDKLLHCPFCGIVPELNNGCDGEGFGYFYIDHECKVIDTDITVHENNKYQLIALWNTRFENKEIDK